jgi:predicted nucleic acid-binding protein
VIAYIDSSVVLRVVLGQAGRLEEWEKIETGVMSALTEVECLRTFDRQRLRSTLSDSEITNVREALFRSLGKAFVVELDRAVLTRAAQSFATVLGTLDAIHLATALLWRDREAPDLVFATHDGALATAARAQGMSVVGI